MSDIVYAIDVHSAWGPDLKEVIDRHNPDHVVLHTYHGYEAAVHAKTMKSQAASVKRAGKTLGMYVWAFRAYNPEQTVRESVDLFREAAGHEPPVVWFDLETYKDASCYDPGPDASWLRAAFAECDRQGLRSGVYTAQWWLDGCFPGGSGAFAEFSNRYLWWANWDCVPELSGPKPIGWPSLHGKQWAVRLPNDQEIDRDVFLPELTVPHDGVVQPPPPEYVVPAVALAHVADTSYDVLTAEAARLRESADALERQAAEAKRVREQFLGPRPNGQAQDFQSLSPTAHPGDGAVGRPLQRPRARAGRSPASLTR